MSSTGVPVGGFEERLLRELRAVVVARAAEPAQSEHRAAPRGQGIGGASPRSWRGLAAIAGVTVLCASGAVAGMAAAGVYSQTPNDPQAWVEGQRVQPEPAVAPDQTAFLGILRRPRVASDVLPAGQAQTFTDSPAAANGPNVDLSRSVQGLPSGSAWVVPGDDRICLLFDIQPSGGGGTCQPDAEVQAGQFPVLTASSPGRAPGVTSVAGVVPDGVAVVTVHLYGGATVEVTVHENVYLAAVHGGVQSVSFQGPSGPITLGA